MTLYKLTLTETHEFFKVAAELQDKQTLYNNMSIRLQGFMKRWQERRPLTV
jgi:hypothetical protein